MSVAPSRNFYKELSTSNPILSNMFCADPCGIEFEGRLYVYGTNDQDQFRQEGIFGNNGYEKINSLVCFSTDDLVNWTFHGEINVKKIAPWILNSWAPSIISRKEKDNLTHFYLYFSNNACGVGVLTSTSPLGPWTDPVGKALVSYEMEEMWDCQHPFDSGVCLDDKGEAYLVFGAGDGPVPNEFLPGTSRIVKLAENLISFDSDFVKIPAPYFFEAGDINFINGTYVYSYNTSWSERKIWPYSQEKPTDCSMAYMTSKTPLISESWCYQNHYFKNPGEQGLNYSNNHTCLVKFLGQWYLLYHTLTLQENTPVNGGFRSICIDKANVDESVPSIALTNGTRRGVEKLKNLDPYMPVAGTCMFTSAEIEFSNFEINSEKNSEIASTSMAPGAWILIKNVDFGETINKFFELKVSFESQEEKKPVIQIRVDKLSNLKHEIPLEKSEILRCPTDLTGIHDLFFVFSEKGINLTGWHVNTDNQTSK